MKKKRKKSFFFEDYNESEIISQNVNLNSPKISLNRVNFLFSIFIVIISIIIIKILYLSTFDKKNFYSENIKQNFTKERRDITDRNGTILARNIDIYDAGVRPKLVKDHKKFLLNLKIIFPKININQTKKKLTRGKFFYIKRRLTEDEYTKLWLLGNKSIEFPKRQHRIYPQKNLFSHILGQIDDKNIGISGIEKNFDHDLKNKKIRNFPFELTLDSNLQYLIRDELINAQSDFNNIGSAAILMKVDNGEVLSLVSLPDFDLNQRNSIENDIYINKITLGVYELGSVFKTFTLAAGLENKIINPSTIFKNLEHQISCDKFTISEHAKLPNNLSAEQILIRSSNIGAVRIAQKLGIDKYKNFLNSLELFEKINFDLGEIGTPLSFKWGKCKLATASYGHGIATTPLQLAKAYAILSNGGYKINPFLLKDKKEDNQRGKQILSDSTSNSINAILRKVVSLDEGTANFANINGYEIAGKTGTALKYKSNEKLNTFVSIFPASDPKYVLLVMLDEPKSAPNYIYNFPPSKKFPNGFKYKGEKRNTSGWNTVEIAGKIIKKIGPILAINNLQASKNF